MSPAGIMFDDNLLILIYIHFVLHRKGYFEGYTFPFPSKMS